jgi:glycine cleavage system H protein
MSNIPDDLKYTKDHEWVRVKGEKAVLGITDYAQHELGDIIFVELPETGVRAEAGKSLGTIEAVKTVADFFSPISGTVEEVNKELADNAGIINQDPYEKGWMFALKIDDPGEIDKLLSADQYKDLIA